MTKQKGKTMRLPGIAIIILGIAGSAFGQGRIANPPKITSLSAFTEATNQVALASRPVELNGVAVVKVFDPRVIYVGDDMEHSVLVRLPTPVKTIKAGQRIDVLGTVSQTQVKNDGWNLSDDIAKQIQGKSIFINATKMRVHGAGQESQRTANPGSQER
jgi:hypothetical protein